MLRIKTWKNSIRSGICAWAQSIYQSIFMISKKKELLPFELEANSVRISNADKKKVLQNRGIKVHIN